MKRLINHSPFQGWKEFHTPNGAWRFERDGEDWKVYHTDSLQSQTYYYEFRMPIINNESARATLERAIENYYDGLYRADI